MYVEMFYVLRLSVLCDGSGRGDSKMRMKIYGDKSSLTLNLF